MTRLHALTWTAAVALLSTAACSVNVSGLPCETDEHCPLGESCVEGACAAQSTDGGASCPAAACRIGVDTECAGDGTVVTCRAGPGGCGSFPPGDGIACGQPSSCAGGTGQAACVCPAPGNGAGQPCATEGATVCEGGLVLRCAASGSCLTWQPGTDCGHVGLSCVTREAIGQCECPAPSGGSLHVDPLAGSATNADVRPSGAASPEVCAFARLTDALKVATPTLGPKLRGYPHHPRWAPQRVHQAGDVIIPATPAQTGGIGNAHIYVAEGGGTTGATEPTWPKAGGATVADGTLSWREAGWDALMLRDEEFPLVVPADITVSSDACATIGSALFCQPGRYALVMGRANGGDKADSAVWLEGRLHGVSVAISDGQAGAAGVSCRKGRVDLNGVWVFGDLGAGSAFGTGFAITGDCEANASFVGAFDVNGIGMHLDSSMPSQVSQGFFGGMDEITEYGNKVAVEVTGSGGAVLTRIFALHSKEHGIRVTTAALTELVEAVVAGNGISGNAASAKPGVWVQSGNLMVRGGYFGWNGRSGIRVESGTAIIEKKLGSADLATPTVDGNGVSSDFIASPPLYWPGLEIEGGRVTASDLMLSSNLGPGVVMGGGEFTGLRTTSTGNLVGVSQSAGTTTLTTPNINGSLGPGLLVTGGSLEVNLGVVGTIGIVKNGIRPELPGHGVLVYAGEVSIRGGPNRLAAISDNREGVELLGGKLMLDYALIDANRGTGVRLRHDVQSPGQRALTLINSRLQWNDGYGLLVADPASEVTFTNNEVASNGWQLTTQPAGIRFAAGADSFEFAGNLVHSNAGHQLRFDAQATTLSQTWQISSASCLLIGANRNRLSCYSQGGVGLFGATGVSVTANDIMYTNPVQPTYGVDYLGDEVKTSGCGVATCPP